jgi:hypothetical protein
MATLRQYFETDFDAAIRIGVSFKHEGEVHAGAVLYDFTARTAFLACYVDGTSRTYDSFLGLLKTLASGPTDVSCSGKVGLPSLKSFHGELKVENGERLLVWYRLLGDYTLRPAQEIRSSGRVFLYAESALSPADVTRLQEEAAKMSTYLQFRSADYVQGRVRDETPLAFISHDWRDKETVAKPIAVALQRMLCPVWYDEFSLRVGDKLRESIEKGLKECKKCVLVLSHNFISNGGWTKTEFDSIFTREVLEQKSLVLPVWYDVTRLDVYNYSPSLANVVGLDWKQLGEDEVCRRLYGAIEN